MGDTSLRVEVLTNGYEVEVRDPKIDEENQKSKSSYKDPWKSYAFTTPEEVVKFIEKALPTLKPESDDEYGTSFLQAMEDDENE